MAKAKLHLYMKDRTKGNQKELARIVLVCFLKTSRLDTNKAKEQISKISPKIWTDFIMISEGITI